ncbi:hypothetical protein EEL33_06185 [Muribaculaceae bacterium Isolate-037 (Harlan)]|uniref:Uncharacterized protein n=1 Tax=Lepagella muris TaxID=3032870 RepID=A0AC61RG67_9BACT|nr:hypothetical protein EEL33_06185 [Muribaculaceae bacterium Isolate-037 (Harlan)]TGY78734.1 hypothetical protein E5331_09175 [Lepagella muris]THG52189.1 hypothetical protein E5984_08455 [Bacteroidales bacterium]TKC55236.1 hypothetical protein E5359_015440 [Bacteroidales bacterium]
MNHDSVLIKLFNKCRIDYTDFMGGLSIRTLTQYEFQDKSCRSTVNICFCSHSSICPHRILYTCGYSFTGR